MRSQRRRRSDVSRGACFLARVLRECRGSWSLQEQSSEGCRSADVIAKIDAMTESSTSSLFCSSLEEFVSISELTRDVVLAATIFLCTTAELEFWRDVQEKLRYIALDCDTELKSPALQFLDGNISTFGRGLAESMTRLFVLSPLSTLLLLWISIPVFSFFLGTEGVEGEVKSCRPPLSSPTRASTFQLH